jgi:enoyl-CoA hydratase/carnithine racemase
MTGASVAPRDQLVHVGWRGEVLTIGLNRPDKLNALSTDLEQALLEALSAPVVSEARALVLHGSGRAFCAGADTSQLDRTPAEIASYYRGSGRVHEVLAGLAPPTVAALHGYCLGGGLELALACDLRIADTTARLALPEVGLGILPSSGGVTRLTRMVGPALARQIILLGGHFDAEQAATWGLLSAVVAEGAAIDRACETAQRLAGVDPHVYEWTTRAIDAATEAPASVSVLVEQLAYAALSGAR